MCSLMIFCTSPCPCPGTSPCPCICSCLNKTYSLIFFFHISMTLSPSALSSVSIFFICAVIIITV